MSYLDVYFSRLNHMGETTAERIKNGGIRSFEKWMAESPHTIRDLSVERGLYFSGIILTNKDKEHEKIMFLNVANNIPLQIGDIMNWQIEDGSIEKWLLVQEEKKVNGTYRTFWIIRCNYLMKWIDAKGHVQQSWSYFVSSLDSKIKGNFRTWNNLITPQPNKYAELLMPRQPIDRATNFIVEDESWSVVEYDHTSVPGVIYLSLTEGKINIIYDDTTNNIADLDRLAQYNLELPELTQSFNVGDIINPVFTLTKNGKPFDAEVEFISKDKSIARLVDNQLTAISAGEVEIIVRLKEYPSIEKTLIVSVGAQQEFSAYIEGQSKIRLDREATYTLKGTEEIVGVVEYSISDPTLATFTVKDNICTVKANDKNILGEVVLTATYNGVDYTKSIQIIPLW